MNSYHYFRAGTLHSRPLLITLMLLLTAISSTSNAEIKKIVYFPEWGVHLQEYYVKKILANDAADKLDVINYSFVIPGPDVNGDVVCQLHDPEAAYQLWHSAEMSVDGEADDPGQPLLGHFNQLLKLKAAKPHLKILAAIGGWTGSTWFSDAALTDQSRQKFVESCIDLLIDGNLPSQGTSGGQGVAAGIFDGFDIDWEYPITGGDGGTHHNSNDDQNLTQLLSKFRELMPAGTLLTMATPGSDFRGDNYQINEDQHLVDWFNLMTYDFHGGWENKTGHLTNILSSPNDPSSDAFKLSLDNTIRLYTETYGVPASKLVAGATMYGLGWKNVSASNNGLYQSGRIADGIHEDGYNYFRDLASPPLEGYNWYWDDHSLAAWLYSPGQNIFWSLDDPQSIALKRRYVDAYQLAGIMFWEITGDDDSSSLLNAMESGNPGPYLQGISENDALGIDITQPANCAISLEGHNVVINAAADAEIKQVEFFQGEESLGFDNQSPWSWAWFNLPPGSHELTAVATTATGQFKLSAPVLINAYQQGTDLRLWQTGVSYSKGSQVFYEGCIYAAKRNHVGSRVRKPSSSSRYWNLVTCSDCSGAGTGGNELPTIQIETPADHQQFTAGYDVTISAIAGDSDGTVNRVEFYWDSAGPETDSIAPYNHSWTNVAPGTFNLRAIVFDDQGDSTEDSVSITVAGVTGCILPGWDPGTSYAKGMEVEHNGIRWRSKRTHSGVEPGTSRSKWSNLGPCSG